MSRVDNMRLVRVISEHHLESESRDAMCRVWSSLPTCSLRAGGNSQVSLFRDLASRGKEEEPTEETPISTTTEGVQDQDSCEHDTNRAVRISYYLCSDE